MLSILETRPWNPDADMRGENPLGEEIILARVVSFNPRRPRRRTVAAQLRPIVFYRWSVPPLHVWLYMCTHHKSRSRGVFGPKVGHVVANSHAGGVAARASTLPAGAAACCTSPAADSS